MKLQLICLMFTYLLALGACQKSLGSTLNNSQTARVGQFPYQVSLQLYNHHFCGGTIINTKWILTAARCTYRLTPNQITVVAGITRLSDNTGLKLQVIYKIEHEKYNNSLFVNDISLLKIKGSIIFSSTIQPVNLSIENIGNDVPVTLSGWGGNGNLSNNYDRLFFVYLKTISNEQCAEAYYNNAHFDNGNTLCTLDPEIKDQCAGDAGGPLVTKDGLIGIVSWGLLCHNYFPNVYTKVSSFVGWIVRNIN